MEVSGVTVPGTSASAGKLRETWTAGGEEGGTKQGEGVGRLAGLSKSWPGWGGGEGEAEIRAPDWIGLCSMVVEQ